MSIVEIRRSHEDEVRLRLAALAIACQLPDDKKEAMAILRICEQLVLFLNDPQARLQ